MKEWSIFDSCKLFEKLLKEPGTLLKLSKEDINNLCFGSSEITNIVDATDEMVSNALSILYYISFREDMSLEDCWQIYWLISYRLFTKANISIKKLPEKYRSSNDSYPSYWAEDPSLIVLYRYIFGAVFENMDYSKLTYRDKELRDKDLVVIITDQFLNIQHSVTKVIMDFCYCLQRDLKKKVVIINEAGSHFYTSEYINGIKMNFVSAYNDIQTITYKDEVFNFYQVPVLMPDIDMYQKMIEMIYSLNPLFVYNIGAACITSDLCTPFVTTAAMPCAIGYPITLSEVLVVAGIQIKKDDYDYKKLLDYQRVIKKEMDHKYSNPETVYLRSDYGFLESDFLYVTVGNRITQEINQQFIDAISRVLRYINIEEHKESRNAYVVIIGNVDREIFISNFPSDVRDYIKTIGSIPASGEFMKICDVYINPQRSGGGSSAFESLHHGKPVVTLEQGDVYYVSGESFGANGWDAYENLLKKYYYDEEFYNAMKEKAVERAGELENIKEHMEKLIQNILN